MIWVVGLVVAVSVIFDTSVTVLLSGMAGMTAVLLLVFKDSILGSVAGIQLARDERVGCTTNFAFHSIGYERNRIPDRSTPRSAWQD